MRKRWWIAVALFGLTLGLTPVRTQVQKTTLYLIATAHLDSQWNWTVQDSIRDYVPEDLPHQLRVLRELPRLQVQLGRRDPLHVVQGVPPGRVGRRCSSTSPRAGGAWPGSWIDAVDTNMPSPESLFRQALYAQRFFRQEFKKEPHDIYLPDCFGFGFALPSIARALRADGVLDAEAHVGRGRFRFRSACGRASTAARSSPS